jgi:hypothetical protein
VGERLAAVPAWAWLAGIVALSCALRLWLVRGMVAPFVFVDEAIYTELARSLADSGSYAVRETPVSGYSLLYPALLAPAYAAFDSLVDAYGAAKATNAVVMSLAAIPAYILARRVAGGWLALLGAVIAVALPSMAYTGTMTTESLFYPVALAFAVVLVRYLERPGYASLAALVVALAVAFATRSQSLAFVPAIATAPLLLALFRSSRASLRPFVPLYVLGAAAALGLVVLQAVRGQSLADLLGAYSIVGEGGYDVEHVLRYWLWHVEELDLYVGIVPFAVLLLFLLRGRTLPERLQEHLAATTALLVWSTLAVGAFASRFASDRVQDRYLFFLAPLLVVCVLAWVELGAPRPRAPTAAAAVAALALVLVFPYVKFIGEPAKSDTLGLIPLWTFNEHLLAGRYWTTVAAAGAVLVAVFLLVPARYALAVPVVLLVLFAILSRPVWSGSHGFVAAGIGALRQGNPGLPRDWIDRAVPAGNEVAVLWTGRADRFTVNMNEFFNRRVGHVYYTDQPTPGGIGEIHVKRLDAEEGDLRAGVFVAASGRPVTVPYALLDGSIVPDGTLVGRNEVVGTALWRLTGPLSSRTEITGIYADTWSGERVRWRLLRCEGGMLTATVHSDPSLFARAQTLRASTQAPGRGVDAFVRVQPTGEQVSLGIRTEPDDGGTCTVDYVVAPTANPSEVIPGSTDDRELGVHFDAFAWRPRP